jgi:hypothetical protein
MFWKYDTLFSNIFPIYSFSEINGRGCCSPEENQEPVRADFGAVILRPPRARVGGGKTD